VDAKRYLQIRQLFDAVLERPDVEREPFLLASANGDRELREEVLRLLQASDRGVDLFENPPTVDVRPSASAASRNVGRRLGPYELVREIAEGGMGVVYLARRADGAFEKQVAIKIVRQELATPRFLARFERERQILAKLEHPISRVCSTAVLLQSRTWLWSMWKGRRFPSTRIRCGCLTINGYDC
jgi:eukaryotic-like serine/threonine-protein kinase